MDEIPGLPAWRWGVVREFDQRAYTRRFAVGGF